MSQTIEKAQAFGYVYLALFAGAIIGIIVAKTVLQSDIATSYMVKNCERTKDVNGKYYKCEY